MILEHASDCRRRLAEVGDAGWGESDGLQRGVEIIRKLNPNVSQNLAWDRARVLIAQMRMEV